MFSYIYYIFYKIVSLGERNWGETSDIQHWKAMFLISLIQIFNLMTLFSIVNYYALFNITFEREHGVITSIIFFCINYLFFIKKKRYKRFIERFDSISKPRKYIFNILGYSYIIFSIVMLFIVLKVFATNNV